MKTFGIPSWENWRTSNEDIEDIRQFEFWRNTYLVHMSFIRHTSTNKSHDLNTNARKTFAWSGLGNCLFRASLSDEFSLCFCLTSIFFKFGKFPKRFGIFHQFYRKHVFNKALNSVTSLVNSRTNRQGCEHNSNNKNPVNGWLLMVAIDRKLAER